jgi:hypothetical protein
MAERGGWRVGSAVIVTSLAACVAGGSAHPPVSYPDDAWARGIEGDVTIETCPAPVGRRALSGPPPLVAATLEALTWEPRRTTEGTTERTIEAPGGPPCPRTTYAFRAHPSAADVRNLVEREETVLVTRGLEGPKRLCGLPPDSPQEGFVTGVSVAVLLIDETGQVAKLSLRQSCGGTNEEAWTAWLRACGFTPASLNGTPVASRFVAKVQWSLD